MLNLCRCDWQRVEVESQENMERRAQYSESSEINSPNKTKPPKFFMKQPPTLKGITSTTNDMEFFGKNTMSVRKDLVKDNFSKTYLLPPSRKDSERNDSTNLSHSQLAESYRGSHILNNKPSIILIEENLEEDEYDLMDLEDGEDFKRNAETKTAAFSKYCKKYATGNNFSDFIKFKEYQRKKWDENLEKNEVLKSRLPEKKVLSMKEYQRSNRGRAKSVSPKKPILSSKRKTIHGTEHLQSTSVRKQVTFSKTNTVLIFVKEDHSSKNESIIKIN